MLSLLFTPATDDVEIDVEGREQLAAAIRSVQAGHATIITLHRAEGKSTRYIFNWREWKRPAPHGRRVLKSLQGAPNQELQDHILDRYAKRVMKLPREYFR